MELARKDPGSWYVVVLKTSEFSHAHNFMAGAFGASGRFPSPQLGTQCVCCDRETARTRDFDPSTDRIQADPIAIPLCEDCEAHVATSTTAGQLAGAGACVGIGLGGYGLLEGYAAIAAAGLVLVALLVAWGLRQRARRRRFALDGHHTGLELQAVNGLCSIRTTNRRLALEVIERNRALVSKTG